MLKALWIFPLLFFTSLMAEENLQPQSLFLSFSEPPSKLYVNQLMPLHVKAIIAKREFDTIQTSFEASKSVEILNPDAPWSAIDSNRYENTFYMKLKSPISQIPLLHVTLFKNGIEIEKQSLTLPLLRPVQLPRDALFSQVIAQTLTVNKHKTTHFDDKNGIIVLEIEATLSNLKDFLLSSIAKNGVDSFSENGINQKIYYYAIIPNYQKQFEFTYFDLSANKFVKISLPIVIETEEISTQLGLNPQESIFQFYKTLLYAIVAFSFFLLFLRRRKVLYFLSVILFGALFFLDQNPLNKVTLKQNSSLMILPTPRSTVFFTNTTPLDVEKLAERGSYLKVLLPDGKIGWTPRENISAR